MSGESSPYPGINAHLNSALLRPGGGWEMFHAEQIIGIRQALDAILPPNYYAASEKSLQVTAIDDAPRRTTPDISLYRVRPGDAATEGKATTPTAILPIDDTVNGDEPEPNAVNIYHLDTGDMPGTLVTRIELLSPANTPGGSHHTRYMQRRHETLHAHVTLVEIDYLHTTPPIVKSIPSYPAREPGATPYYVLVSHPQPTVTEGQMSLYAVAVDAPLPYLRVPLAVEDTVVLDLQTVYTRLVAGTRVFNLLAELSRPLVNPGAYSEADQQRIRELVTAAE